MFVLQVIEGGSLGTGGSAILDDLAPRASYVIDLEVGRWFTFLTATLLHADLVHIFGNMLALFVFGLPLEEKIGRVRFLVIYLATAFAAVPLHAAWVYLSGAGGLDVPIVGASGAVFGVLAAIATMYPFQRVPWLLALGFFFMGRTPFPVVYGALVFMSLEMLYFLSPASSGVAHVAHLGGAVAGGLLALPLKPKMSPEAARDAPRRLDYGVLDRLATRPEQKNLVQKLRENEDHAAIQRAWLDKLIDRLECPSCGMPLSERKRGTLSCERGHEERYVA